MRKPTDWISNAAMVVAGGFVLGEVNSAAEIERIIRQHVPEGPLLQCIDCKNTESPAGAMARAHFNPGRCVHCGGYFKVIRA